MPRLGHGAVINLDELRATRNRLVDPIKDLPLGFAAVRPIDLQDFDYLFPDLQHDPANLLPESPQTVLDLARLGRTMRDVFTPGAGDSDIPAVFTYLGQFVDHDVTLETGSADLANLFAPNLAPLGLEAIRATIRNLRTATLDLDNVYGLPAPRDPANAAKMLIGRVTALGATEKPGLRPPGKGDDNDLPREGRSSVDIHDRAALIGDPRNDENTIVAQLHVAFLKAHNRLVDEGRSFRQAQRILRQHYQHLVIHDFLKRVADPQIVDDILQHSNHPKRVYDALAEPFFLPLEYSFAAYRFGHSMVRAAYNFNLNFNFSGEPGTIRATLELLFTFTALSGQLGFGPATDTLPENWIIEWENLVDQGTGARFDKARLIDTKLVEPLFGLRNFKGEVATVPGEADPGHPEPGDAASLAIRNLLRGYLLRLPTGQAVARALELPALTPAEIEAVASQVQAPAGVEAQADVLREAGFLERTPLWYYVLAEAAHGGGQHLGPVGSTIVAEVLIGLVRRSRDSILRFTNRRRPVAGAIADRLAWRPSLPSAQPGTFTLADLLRFARVLP